MELRHLRYFVAVAEQGSFVQAARQLRVAQPALSKQIQNLEAELGVALLHRLPRGVRLTPAGEAFFVQACNTLDAARRAVSSAREVGKGGAADLEFTHGEMAVYTTVIEDLLAAFRDAHPEVQMRVSSKSDADTFTALRERQVDIAAVFVAQWPIAGFEALRIVDAASKGVLLPANHPLAAGPSVRLPDLRDLTWMHSSPQRWPGFMRVIQDALRERGLVPARSRERPKETPASNIQIAAGDTWALASEAVAAPYRTAPKAIVYRPFEEAPIPCWIALVWSPKASRAVTDLVAIARDRALAYSR